MSTTPGDTPLTRIGANSTASGLIRASTAPLSADALTAKASVFVPVPDQGGYAADLRAFLRATFTLGSDPRVVDLLRALMTHSQLDPAFGERFRERFLQARRDALGVILDRAAARGDLPAAPTKETVADIVFGIVWYRILATQQPLDQALGEELLALLTGSTSSP